MAAPDEDNNREVVIDPTDLPSLESADWQELASGEVGAADIDEIEAGDGRVEQANADDDDDNFYQDSDEVLLDDDAEAELGRQLAGEPGLRDELDRR